ncbi:unnamed protein product, partial [Porites evermanni]
EKCAPVVDVAFLVDSSGSIRSRDYRKMKTFVSKMVEQFNISPAGSRAAVVQYSTKATTVIRFGFSYTPLDEASQLMKDVGVLVIAIGIGKSVKREELEQIASSKKDVIIAKSFDDLLPAVESLTQTACEDIEGK